MIVITGATGQLGRLVIEQLLQHVAPAQIVAAVRDPAKAAGLAAKGVQIRHADYNQPASLDGALEGASKVLLISSSEVGARVPQHGAVIDAALRAGVGLVAYTSVLHADRSTLGLAGEHRETEALLKASGLPTVLLRNGWYHENYAAAVPAAVAHGMLIGSASEGRIASAGRTDYAAAAVQVLTAEGHAGRTYELAGDTAYTLPELAAEIAHLSGKSVGYRNLPEAEYADALKQSGMPAPLAEMLAGFDIAASHGALFDEGGALGKLIGRPTTPMAETIGAALRG